MLASSQHLYNELNLILSPNVSVSWVDETGSTNHDLRAQIKTHPHQKYLRGTLYQTAGTGRSGKPFLTKKQHALLFSYAQAIEMPIHLISCLSLCVGIVAVAALREFLPQDQHHHLNLKWPNDLFWKHKKLAGILIESVKIPHASSGKFAIIIGMGFNLNGAEALSEQLQRPIADWAEIGAHGQPSDLVGNIVRGWMNLLSSITPETLQRHLQLFSNYDLLYQKTVQVCDAETVLYSGIAQGIDSEGRLKVQTPEKTHFIIAGDVSIKGQS